MPTLDPRDLTRHVDRLYRAAWALCGSRHDAEDLVQETFARVLARPRSVRPGYELAYLLQALRNTFISSRRGAARRPPTNGVLDEATLEDPGTRSDPGHALEVQEVYAAIAALPDAFRAAIVAVDVMGLSYAEASKALGVKEATITTRLFRARSAVERDVLGDGRREGSAPSGVSAGGGPDEQP